MNYCLIKTSSQGKKCLSPNFLNFFLEKGKSKFKKKWYKTYLETDSLRHNTLTAVLGSTIFQAAYIFLKCVFLEKSKIDLGTFCIGPFSCVFVHKRKCHNILLFRLYSRIITAKEVFIFVDEI